MACMRVLVVLLGILGVTCGIPLSEFYPFGEEAGDTEIPSNDDDSSSAVDLPLPFPFFDTLHQTVYVNNNGDISFNGPVGAYTPSAFPLDSLPLIAPYWADVDTRGTGQVWYRDTVDETLRNRARDLIKARFIDQTTFEPDYLFIATWDHVGYYSEMTDKTNTFQCVMATNGVVSFVIFLYADDSIQWTTGDASGGTNGLGGTPAQAGFNAGDGVRSASVPGSRTADIINITMTSNVENMLGVWVFQVDEEDISMRELTLSPRFGNMLGGTPVRVSVTQFTFEMSDDISCKFDKEVVAGVYVNGIYALCISPQFAAPRSVSLQLTVTRDGNVDFQGEQNFFALSTDRAHAVDYIPSQDQSVGLRAGPGHNYNIIWNKDNLLSMVDSSSFTVDISMYYLPSDSKEWIYLFDLVEESIENGGSFADRLPFPLDFSSIPHSCRATLCPVIILVKINLGFASSESQVLTKLQQNGLMVGLWSGVRYYSLASSSLANNCIDWENKQGDIGTLLRSRLRSCPSTLSRAETPNSGFVEQKMSSVLGDTSYDLQWMEYFHRGARVCYVQSTYQSSDEGSRQQCCYKSNGMLLVESGGGTADLYAPLDTTSTANHIFEDIIPYIYCCTDVSNCDLTYVNHRPIATKIDPPPPPACVYGDPHIVTLDGLKYTFNGKGEFTLIETDGDFFSLQGRMVEAEGADGENADATVFSALVTAQSDSDTVQFALSRRGIDTRVNGQLVDFSDLDEQPFANVTLSDRGNDSYSATFSSGAYIEVRRENDIISTVLVSLPTSFQGTTKGLMGLYNGDTSDDLAPRSGDGVGQPISTDVSLEEVHEQFGITWIISNQEDSLFTYTAEETFETFYDPDFSPTFEIQFTDTDLEERAMEICGEDQFCLYDIAATQNTNIGLTTLMGSEEFDSIVILSAPITCDPPCENGACVENDTCSCTDGYFGATCSEQVAAEECDVNPCQNGGSCSLIGRNYVCDCMGGFYGFICQNSPPIDCDCTSNMECSINGNFVRVDSTEVIPNGKQLKCLIAFNNDAIELDTFHVDAGFDSSQQFLSAGSLTFLNNLGILQGRDQYSSCEISDGVITSLPSGSPSATLEDFGVDELQVQYMETDGTFGSIQLSNNRVEEIVRDADYTLDGSLSDDNACSLQHLIYWLATLNEPASSGSGAEPADTTQTSGDGDVFGSGNGILPPEPEVLPVSITSTMCKQAGEDDSTTIVFPVNC